MNFINIITNSIKKAASRRHYGSHGGGVLVKTALVKALYVQAAIPKKPHRGDITVATGWRLFSLKTA
jgi:hypothetical protein